MCDTFVCPPAFSENGKMILGKNSDREPSEAQQLIRIVPDNTNESQLRCTYIAIPNPGLRYEAILSKPFHMWGAEMGMNEKGLSIGNEAVFTKVPIRKNDSGLTGMDLLRIALQSCQDAEEAVALITELIEVYGQDACGGYLDRNFYYHNSFMIADAQNAYVIETAGHFWVLEKVKNFRAISNGLSIEEKFDAIHPGAIAYAISNGWHKKGETFNFKKSFSATIMPFLAACEIRRTFSEQHGINGFSVKDAFALLRGHQSNDFVPKKASTKDICMHNNGLFCPHQTTGSMVAELSKDGNNTIWLTGSAAPCLSLFKPFYIGTDNLNAQNFIAPGAKPDMSYWWIWENYHRKALKNYTESRNLIAENQTKLESDWITRSMKVMHTEDKYQLSKEALEQSLSLLQHH